MSANLLRELGELVAVSGRARHGEEVFGAVDAALQRLVGHKLMTILVYDAAVTTATRVYSSDGTYPAGMRDPVASVVWADAVVRRGVPYVGNRLDDLQVVFDHHEKLAALGLGSVINLPIRRWDRTVGTLNLLHEEGHFVGVDLQRVALVAHFIACWLAPVSLEQAV